VFGLVSVAKNCLLAMKVRIFAEMTLLTLASSTAGWQDGRNLEELGAAPEKQ
jgi:hypothetical protein